MLTAGQRRVVRWLLVGVLPTLLVALGNARFIINHFYARAPELLDSGWYSWIVYRAGVLQKNPVTACNYAELYYGVHVSPLTSIFSILSYASPLDRIEWYALFQGFVFAPLGFAVYLVASRLEPDGTCRVRWPIAVIAAIAFAFDAQVLLCVGYPHYEVAIPAFACVFLACLVTERTWLAWIALFLTLSVREDAGIHVGLALLAFAWVNERGPRRFVTRRVLVVLIGISFGASVVAIGLQKLAFHSANLLRSEFLGTPAFGHVTTELLAHRLRYLFRYCPFITIPLVAAAGIAAIRRDPRYLLGWAVGVPWLVFNLLAHWELKSQFAAYTGFPFIISFFWVYLYGAVLAPAQRRLAAPVLEAFVAVTSIATVVAAYADQPWTVSRTFRDMAVVDARTRDASRAFRAAILHRPELFGRLVVDRPVAALALEAIEPSQVFRPEGLDASVDSVAFHQEDNIAGDLLPALDKNGITRCAHVVDTGWSVCRREPLSLEPLPGVRSEDVPPLLAFASTDARGRRLAPERGVVRKEDPPGIAFDGVLRRVEGEREVVWRLAIEEIETVPGEPIIAEVLVGSAPPITTKMKTDDAVGERELVVPFSARREEVVIVRLWLWARGTYTITGAALRKR